MDTEFRIWLINGTAFLVSFSTLNNYVKFALLVVSFGYTVTKWYKLLKNDPDLFPYNPLKKDKDVSKTDKNK